MEDFEDNNRKGDNDEQNSQPIIKGFINSIGDLINK